MEKKEGFCEIHGDKWTPDYLPCPSCQDERLKLWKDDMREDAYQELNEGKLNEKQYAKKLQNIAQFLSQPENLVIKDFHCSEHGFIRPEVYCPECIPTTGEQQ